MLFTLFVSVKSEEKLLFNGATAPQVSTESVANNSTADILNNHHRFIALLLPHAAAAHYKYKELDCDEYNEVKYWDQDSFNKWFQNHGKTSSPTPCGQLSKKLYFLENEDGEVIRSNEINAMRNTLVCIFSSIKEHIPGMLKKWLKNPMEFHDMIYIEMQILFLDCFTLCKNDWKACKFAKNYSTIGTMIAQRKGMTQTMKMSMKRIKLVEAAHCPCQSIPGWRRMSHSLHVPWRKQKLFRAGIHCEFWVISIALLTIISLLVLQQK